MFQMCPTCGKSLSAEERQAYLCNDCNPPIEENDSDGGQ